MGILSRLSRVFGGKAVKALPVRGEFSPDNRLAQQLLQFLAWFNGTPIFEDDLEKLIKEGYILNPHVYTVINAIIEPAKHVPFLVYKVTDKKAFGRYKAFLKEGKIEEAEIYASKALELVEGTPMNTMIEDAPNETQTWSEFQEASMGYHLLTGNDFMYGLESAGFDYFTQIYNLPAQVTEIITDGWQKPIKEYRVHLANRNIQGFAPSTVLHRKKWNPAFGTMHRPQDYLYGLSPMKPLCQTVRRSNQAISASWHLLKNGFPPGVLSSESDVPITDDDRDSFKAAWKRTVGGGENANIPVLSPTKMTWLALGLKSADMELLESQKSDLKDIARVYSVPLPIVTDDKSTYNNILEAEKALWMKAIVPEMISFRDGFNNLITRKYNEATGQEFWCDFDLKAVPALQEDKAKKSEQLLKEMEKGLWTGNEVRRMLDYEEDPANELLNQRLLSTGLKYSDVEKVPAEFRTFISVINSLSPLVANNVIGAMTENELRALVGVGDLPDGELTINQLIATRGQGVDPSTTNSNGTQET